MYVRRRLCRPVAEDSVDLAVKPAGRVLVKRRHRAAYFGQGSRLSLAPYPRSDSGDRVVELDFSGPLVPAAAAATPAVPTLVKHLVLAAPGRVEAQLECPGSVGERLDLDGTGCRTTHGYFSRRSLLVYIEPPSEADASTRPDVVVVVHAASDLTLLSSRLVRDEVRPTLSGVRWRDTPSRSCSGSRPPKPAIALPAFHGDNVMSRFSRPTNACHVLGGPRPLLGPLVQSPILQAEVVWSRRGD